MRPYVAWIPMLDADEGSEVPFASRSIGVTPQYFDGEKRLGLALAKRYGFEQPLWDVFLFYGPEAVWTEDGPPLPELVLAQAGGVIVATRGVLPPIADQSKLLPELAGKLEVIAASQAEFPAILERLAVPFAARHAR